jgi:hypothetical protein
MIAKPTPAMIQIRNATPVYTAVLVIYRAQTVYIEMFSLGMCARISE